MQIARQIVDAKINNSLVVIKRRLRKRKTDQSLDQALSDFTSLVKKTRNKLARENSLNELLGMEGSIAKGYFSLFRQLIPAYWEFDNRNRLPPKDPVNVLLSLGYTVLFNHIHTFCKLHRLNPTFGYLHQGNDTQPSLILDLMEEFRAPVIDACVLSAINSGQIVPEDFETGDNYCNLKPEGYRRFVTMLEKKLNSQLAHPSGEGISDYRRLMEHQVRHIKHLIHHDSDEYTGYLIR